MNRSVVWLVACLVLGGVGYAVKDVDFKKYLPTRKITLIHKGIYKSRDYKTGQVHFEDAVFSLETHVREIGIIQLGKPARLINITCGGGNNYRIIQTEEDRNETPRNSSTD